MYALSIGSVAPESFGLELSVLYLAMIVLGGLGSVGGAALGAVFVSALPLVFQRYADALPVRRRRRRGRPRRRRGGPLAVRPRDRPRRPLRAGRPGRLRRTLPPQGPRPRRRPADAAPPPHQQSTTPSRPTHQHKGAPHEARPAFARRGRCWPPSSSPQPPAAAPRPRRPAAGAAGGEAAEVQTDVGVEGDDHHSSASSPTSPASFAALGKDITNANDAVLGGEHRSATPTTSSSTSRTPATSRSRACSSTAA